jgi:hypothetical protein
MICMVPVTILMTGLSDEIMSTICRMMST